MIVRVQSRSGTRRLGAAPADTLQRFLEKVVKEFGLSVSDTFSLFLSPGHRDELTRAHLSMQLQDIPVRHGDMLYLAEKLSGVAGGQEEKEVSEEARILVPEDEVDIALDTKDGKIQRKRDSQLCHHGVGAKCMNCAPLDPWDQRYLDSLDTPLKHLSFHCHMRKLMSGVDKGKFVNLEDLSCKIRDGCSDHPPWPAGICTKCQPSAITLSRQSYRHVDNIMFEDAAIVGRFLDSWRATGNQRLGYLLGYYAECEDVPLGIRAIVCAIYEPPQEGSRYSVELLEDEQSKAVQELADCLGLRKVGWIFTDLEAEGKEGKVAYKRSVHTHLLSAEECIMTADLQNDNPNPCKLSSNGYFGSKFVTVCVSGNEQNQVDTRGYQVSNQCMALVRDDCLVPTLDAKELGYIRESTAQQYVPDVFFKTKGEYGSDVTKLARPLPLEYLLIELTVSSPRVPKPLLAGVSGDAFPVENRAPSGQQLQSMDSLSHYLRKNHGINFFSYMADFHLLYYLYTSKELEVAGVALRDLVPELCHAIKAGDRKLADGWRKSELWSTVEQLVATDHTSSSLPLSGGPSQTSAAVPSQWACQHCTLLNPARQTICDACHLPRDS